MGEDILYDLWRNDFAGTAPGCEGVEDDDLVFFDGGAVFSFAVEGNYVSIYSIKLNAIPCELKGAGKSTHFARLWTPMLTVEFLNPLTKLFVKAVVLGLRFDLIVCAVSFDDLKKKDIQVLCL